MRATRDSDGVVLLILFFEIMVLPFFPRYIVFEEAAPKQGEEPSGKVLPPDSDPFNTKPFLRKPYEFCLVRRRLIFM
jgi:hypothetical protein